MVKHLEDSSCAYILLADSFFFVLLNTFSTNKPAYHLTEIEPLSQQFVLSPGHHQDIKSYSARVERLRVHSQHCKSAVPRPLMPTFTKAKFPSELISD